MTAIVDLIASTPAAILRGIELATGNPAVSLTSLLVAATIVASLTINVCAWRRRNGA